MASLFDSVAYDGAIPYPAKGSSATPNIKICVDISGMRDIYFLLTVLTAIHSVTIRASTDTNKCAFQIHNENAEM